MTAEALTPFLIALNLTRRCNLRCEHCYLDAGTRDCGADDELSTGEVKKLIDEIADMSDETMIVLTGGEPLLRPDIMQIASHATERGLMTVMGTNGLMLSKKRVGELKDAGVLAAGISLDSLDPAYHDNFRGAPGAWEKTMAGIDNCRKAGILVQVHFSVTEENAHEVDDMIAFCRDMGASVLNIFFLVCTGRGERFTNISAETYERVLRRVTEAAREESGLVVRARCAPHFKRMAMELTPPLPVTQADGYEAGGCLAGTRYARITPEGDVTACPYIEESVGSVRQSGFADIWSDAPMFARLRSPELKGRCGACEYAVVCGGCRARPFARDGDLMGEDFLCAYEPGGGEVIKPASSAGSDIKWTPEAEERLKRVPAFVRRFVKSRVVAHVLELGESEVTAQHLETLAKRRFGKAMPHGAPRS